MGYFMEEASDGSIAWRKDKGYNHRKSDKKKYKRIGVSMRSCNN